MISKNIKNSLKKGLVWEFFKQKKKRKEVEIQFMNYQGRCRGWCRQQQVHGREWCTQQLGKKIIKLCASQFHTFSPPEKIASQLTRRDVGVCVEGSRGSSRELLNGGRSCGRGEVVRGGRRGQEVVGGGGGSLAGVVEDMVGAPGACC